MSTEPPSHPPLPPALPVRYVDDRRYFEGYAIPAMNSEQLLTTHRRIVADINGEYRHNLFSSAWAKGAVILGIATNALLVVLTAVALLVGR